MSKTLELQDKADTPEFTEMVVRLIGLSVVIAMTSLGKTTLYKLIALGEFPKPVQLTADGTRVAWLFHEVQEWILERATQRNLLSGGSCDE